MMTREDALMEMTGAALIEIADALGVKAACNKTRTALKEAKAKVIARILEAEAALEAQEDEPQEAKPQETEPQEDETQEAEPLEAEPQETEPQEDEPQEDEPLEDKPQELESQKTDPQELETQEAEPLEAEPQEDEPLKDEPQELESQETEAVPDPPTKKTKKRAKAEKKTQEPAEVAAAITTFADIFDKLNDIYFDNLLPKATIAIRCTSRTYDHCTVKKSNAESQYAVEVCASAIGKPIEETAAGILHAMVHIYCMETGIAETCQKGRYHNRKFKKECEDRDLVVGYDSANGFVHTAPSEIFGDRLKNVGVDLGIQLAAIPSKKKGMERV